MSEQEREAFECKCCGSTDLSWNCFQKNLSDVQDGRLRLHDVGTGFYLGCNECSETLGVVDGDDVARILDATREQSRAQYEGAKVGCERDDGLLNIHFENETCEVCREVVLDNERFRQQSVDQWVRCSERLPTEKDAGILGKVWVLSPINAIWLMDIGDVRNGTGPNWRWMPTGLRKPPAPEES